MKKHLVKTAEQKKYEIDISEGKFEVFVKDLTFLDMQIAAQALMRGKGLDLPTYWEYAFRNWVTIPTLTNEEMMMLSPEAGKAISDLLPSPEEMIGMLGFSKAESDL